MAFHESSKANSNLSTSLFICKICLADHTGWTLVTCFDENVGQTILGVSSHELGELKPNVSFLKTTCFYLRMLFKLNKYALYIQSLTNWKRYLLTVFTMNLCSNCESSRPYTRFEYFSLVYFFY